MSIGPQSFSRPERRQRARDLAAQIQTHYGRAVQAIGIYGSLAYSSDGPYSDIEMYCVLRGEGIEDSLEWSAGPWKAEIDLYSPDVLHAWATTIEGDWPITHGSILHIWSLFDPDGFFPALRLAALAVPDSEFQQAMQALIVGEIYEMVGKIRNAVEASNTTPLAYYAGNLAVYGACLVGLGNRHTYCSFSRLFTDSLALTGAPDGYASLCQLVISGKLSEATEIALRSNAFWEGIESWALVRGLAIHTSLDDLLALKQNLQHPEKHG